jgi:hypothetical protein
VQHVPRLVRGLFRIDPNRDVRYRIPINVITSSDS